MRLSMSQDGHLRRQLDIDTLYIAMNADQRVRLRNIVQKFSELFRNYGRADLELGKTRNRPHFTTQRAFDVERGLTLIFGDHLNSIISCRSLLTTRSNELQAPTAKLENQLEVVEMMGKKDPSKQTALRKYFHRTAEQQKKWVDEGKADIRWHFAEKPAFCCMDEFSIFVEDKQVPESSFTISGRKAQLLQLREGKLVPGNIIDNYLKMLRLGQKMEDNIQIASVNFLSSVMREVRDRRMEDNLERLVGQIMEREGKGLQAPILARKLTVLPVLVDQHYSLVIVRKIDPTAVQLIYCSSRHTLTQELTSVLQAILTIEKNKQPLQSRDSPKNMQILQLMVPRQVRVQDSGLNLMLNCECLLVEPRQLEQLQDIEKRKKNHLFPRSLAQSMRQRIWNLYSDLTDPRQAQKLRIVRAHFCERIRFKEQADFGTDYDVTERREVQKLKCVINMCSGQEEDDAQRDYFEEVKTYYHRIVNYYEE